MRWFVSLCLLVPLSLLVGCRGTECAFDKHEPVEIVCDSILTVDYGAVVVNEPYSLSINPGGTPVTVTCLADEPDAEPLPEWLTCDANGFEITGEYAENTTISVAVVPLSTGEAVIPNALVPLTVDEINEPNGHDCDPVCYERSGTTQGV